MHKFLFPLAAASMLMAAPAAAAKAERPAVNAGEAPLAALDRAREAVSDTNEATNSLTAGAPVAEAPEKDPGNAPRARAAVVGAQEEVTDQAQGAPYSPAPMDRADGAASDGPPRGEGNWQPRS